MALDPELAAVAVKIANAQFALAVWLMTLAKVNPVAVGTAVKPSPVFTPSSVMVTTMMSPVTQLTLAVERGVVVALASPTLAESVGGVLPKHIPPSSARIGSSFLTYCFTQAFEVGSQVNP